MAKRIVGEERLELIEVESAKLRDAAVELAKLFIGVSENRTDSEEKVFQALATASRELHKAAMRGN